VKRGDLCWCGNRAVKTSASNGYLSSLAGALEQLNAALAISLGLEGRELRGLIVN